MKVLPQFNRSSVARDVFKAALVVLLRASSSKLTFGAVVRGLRQAITLIRGDKPVPNEQELRTVYDAIADVSQLFRFDDENAMWWQ